MRKKVRIIGIGGSLDRISATYFALKFVMDEIHSLGAETILYDVREMIFPIYDPKVERKNLKNNINTFLDNVHSADAYVFASPEYHGTVSGIFKNVIDYLEYLKGSNPPYLSNKPVGCIATGGGEISGVTTIQAMIHIIHNLRGISASTNTAISSSGFYFDEKGKVLDEKIKRRLERLAKEVHELAKKLSH